MGEHQNVRRPVSPCLWPFSTLRLVSVNDSGHDTSRRDLGLQCLHKGDQIFLFLVSEFSLKNQIKELDRIFQGQ